MQDEKKKRSNQPAAEPQPGDMNSFNQRNHRRGSHAEDAEGHQSSVPDDKPTTNEQAESETETTTRS